MHISKNNEEVLETGGVEPTSFLLEPNRSKSIIYTTKEDFDLEKFCSYNKISKGKSYVHYRGIRNVPH